jgi:hypothetical protein
MPRLGPSCLVLFLPRMLLLHPYIHLAGNVARDEDTSRGASRPGQKRCCVALKMIVVLFCIDDR